MDRVIDALQALKEEIGSLRSENSHVHELEEILARCRAENAELREELIEIVNDYAGLLDRDYGNRGNPQPSRDYAIIQKARGTLARHKELKSL